MVTRSAAAVAAAVVGVVTVATTTLPSAQAFAPSVVGSYCSFPVSSRLSFSTALSMGYGTNEECPEIPTTPLLSSKNEVAVLALG
mmetsp:Transcript_3955/g.9050  ORF Transcript_3955/g.9050 Transcript_3955/m.9050 type:complete len:85 (-) Transcript_3955:581-835(-)